MSFALFFAQLESENLKRTSIPKMLRFVDYESSPFHQGSLTHEEASQLGVSAQGSRKLLSVDLHSATRTAATAATIPVTTGSTASDFATTNSDISVDDDHLHHLLPGSGLIGGLGLTPSGNIGTDGAIFEASDLAPDPT